MMSTEPFTINGLKSRDRISMVVTNLYIHGIDDLRKYVSPKETARNGLGSRVGHSMIIVPICH